MMFKFSLLLSCLAFVSCVTLGNLPTEQQLKSIGIFKHSLKMPNDSSESVSVVRLGQSFIEKSAKAKPLSDSFKKSKNIIVTYNHVATPKDNHWLVNESLQQTSLDLYNKPMLMVVEQFTQQLKGQFDSIQIVPNQMRLNNSSASHLIMVDAFTGSDNVNTQLVKNPATGRYSQKQVNKHPNRGIVRAVIWDSKDSLSGYIESSYDLTSDDMIINTIYSSEDRYKYLLKKPTNDIVKFIENERQN